MSRAIDADALIDKIVNTPTTPCAQKYVGNFVYMDGTATRQNEIIDMINEQPTIEPERKNCKSCRYNSLEWDEEPCDSCTMGGSTNRWKPAVEPERKKGKWVHQTKFGRV